MLKLLAHPSEKVRVVSYQLIAGKLKNITHEALIWEREIIGEVAAFGLFDTTKEVQIINNIAIISNFYLDCCVKFKDFDKTLCPSRHLSVSFLIPGGISSLH